MGFGRLFCLENAMEWDQVYALKEWRALRNQAKAQEREKELEREKEMQLAKQSVTGDCALFLNIYIQNF